jgi:hypothetical protein
MSGTAAPSWFFAARHHEATGKRISPPQMWRRRTEGDEEEADGARSSPAPCSTHRIRRATPRWSGGRGGRRGAELTRALLHAPDPPLHFVGAEEGGRHPLPTRHHEATGKKRSLQI